MNNFLCKVDYKKSLLDPFDIYEHLSFYIRLERSMNNCLGSRCRFVQLYLFILFYFCNILAVTSF